MSELFYLNPLATIILTIILMILTTGTIKYIIIKEKEEEMFKLRKIIEKYMEEKIKELRSKDKKEMTETEIQLINCIEEMERKNGRI